jgi:hypothetical protein
LDCDGSSLTVYFRYAVRQGHQAGAGKIQFRRAASVLIVDRLHTSADDRYAESRHVVHMLNVTAGLRIGLSERAQAKRDSYCKQQFCFQNISFSRSRYCALPMLQW